MCIYTYTYTVLLPYALTFINLKITSFTKISLIFTCITGQRLNKVKTELQCDHNELAFDFKSVGTSLTNGDFH